MQTVALTLRVAPNEMFARAVKSGRLVAHTSGFVKGVGDEGHVLRGVSAVQGISCKRNCIPAGLRNAAVGAVRAIQRVVATVDRGC